MTVSPFPFPSIARRVAAATLVLSSAVLHGVGYCAQEDTRTFRVMSYNIQHGRGLDEVVDLERIARVIRAEKAGLVGLQEVDRGVRRTDGVDQPAELSLLTGMSAMFEVNHPHQGGEYGNANLSRFPVRDVRNTHLPRIDSTEQRGVLQAVVEIHGQEVLFLNTHIAHRRQGEAERLASVDVFAQILEENDGSEQLPVIFVGDFNDVPGTKTYERMSELLVDTWLLAGEGPGDTIPVREPRRRLDYVWVSEDAPFEPVEAWVPYTEASDHLPVVVEFAFTEEESGE